MKEKIFIGLLDIASQISDWKKGFTELGYETFTASMYKQHVVQRMEVDVDISKMWKLSYRGVRPRKLQSYLQDRWHFSKNKVFQEALSTCDIFIIIGRGFYGNYRDFKLIKQRGKKLICIFTGDDSRWYYCMKQEFESYGMPPIEYEPGYDYSITNLEKHLAHLRGAEKYADVIVSIPNQAQMALRPYYLFYSTLDLPSFPFSPEQRVIPKIVHAPSNPHFKGSKYFFEALDRLKSEGVQFDFQLVQNVPNQEAIRLYQDADILLNQVYCPCGGKLAHEGMALGKVVLSRMGYDHGYDEKTPADCPIVDVGPDTVYQKLKEVVQDVELRKKLAVAGREYVTKYNAAPVVAKKLLDRVKDNNQHPDFVPTFFKDKFVPESDEAIPIYNKWNKFVSCADWYKERVGNFERAGLIF